MYLKTFQHNFFLLFSAFVVFCAIWLTYGCNKEEINTDPKFKLELSTDTVLFDTVFTTIGSSTRQFVIRNKSNEKINIASIALAGGQQSAFRINVDGVSAFQFKDIEIGANDSAFVFVKVTIDPTNQNQALVQADSVLFSTNGNIQNVKLVAWGQDAHFYNNSLLAGSIQFTAEKPHVIYGNLTLDTAATLTIEAGAQLCFHKNSKLIALSEAKVIANGTKEHPIVMRGDSYASYKPEKDTVPGQWIGLHFNTGSGKHLFTYTKIINALVGIEVDSSATGIAPAITMQNSIVSNMTNYGVYLRNASMLAANCEFSNCGAYILAIEGGNGYDFRHCTFANYWPFTARKVSSVLLGNFYFDSKIIAAPLYNVYFGNCIINSYHSEELELNKQDGFAYELQFENCLISTELEKNNPEFFISCLIDKEVKFLNPSKLNFQLDTLSDAKDYGNISIINSSLLDIHSDMFGVSRTNDLGPDLGAYERVEKR